MVKTLGGIIVPVVTPFHRDETLNERGLRRLVQYLISQGVNGIMPCGSQGEFHTLTLDERKRVLEVVVEEVHGQVLVLAHTGAITTRESVELTEHAGAAGADAVSLITPYYIRPTSEEIYQHYMRVAEVATVPVMAYNNPERTG